MPTIPSQVSQFSQKNSRTQGLLCGKFPKVFIGENLLESFFEGFDQANNRSEIYLLPSYLKSRCIKGEDFRVFGSIK